MERSPAVRWSRARALADAVERELREETGLDGAVRGVARLGRAHGPGVSLRHPRLHRGGARRLTRRPVAGSDAAAAAWVPLEEVPGLALVDGLEEFLRAHGVID